MKTVHGDTYNRFQIKEIRKQVVLSRGQRGMCAHFSPNILEMKVRNSS